MKEVKKYICFISIIIFCFTAKGNNPIILFDDGFNQYIGNQVEILKDTSLSLKIENVVNSTNFKLSNQRVPSFGFENAVIWCKFEITNNSSYNHLILELAAPLIDEAELFYLNEGKTFSSVLIGQIIPFSSRKYKTTTYLYDLYIDKGISKTYFLRIKSSDQVEIPLKINTPLSIFSSKARDSFMFGIYSGIMLIMIFYNFFIYLSIRDKSYLFYVIYILAVLLTQTTFHGYTFKYLWSDSPNFEMQSILLLSVFVGVSSIQFLRVFLNTSKFVPKLDKPFFVAYFLYFVSIIFIFFDEYQTSWKLILGIVSPLSLYMLFVSFKIARKGYRPAKFFTIAWSFFLIGVFIYAMKSYGLLPYNNFTVYLMPIGSAVETVLLSFALADRINIYKKERLEVIEENERLVREQNVVLEQKVKERTSELNKAINNLKQAQSQLVESEKMASLGQLTAGIAHEINNPINFVSSNVFPLKQDVEDLKSILNKYAEITESDDLKTKLNEINQLKEELDYQLLLEELDTIINGIEDGAKRTAEIVSGLRNFSRLDESECQSANVNDCINTTLKIIKPKLGDINVITELGDIPPIDCYPGKLNQFFLNTIDNAIYAINAVKKPNHKGEIKIKTTLNNDHIIVTLKDNGIGMDENTKNKIFDPFFTTKDVGEGTGLGMSIAHGILEIHQAKIEIESEINKGTQIKIFLPLTLPTWKE